ncbi:MAG: HAD-IA family hydrolase [Candidatus Jordarchaeales archaeon]|nr:HAD-IA family hydrolase [Candidatus Jordarchaeia archaeon]
MEVKDRVKAVLFDLDETLLKLPVNYEELREKLRHCASRLNLKFEFRRILEDIDAASRIAGDDFRRECYEIVESYELEAAMKPIPEQDAAYVLEKLKEGGLRIGVVSRNSRRCILASLEKLGLTKHVDVIIGREDTQRTKPNPEPIIYALKLLGVEADEAVYVGDHPYDLAAASAAGVTFIAVGDKIRGYGSRVRSLREIISLISI